MGCEGMGKQWESVKRRSQQQLDARGASSLTVTSKEPKVEMISPQKRNNNRKNFFRVVANLIPIQFFAFGGCFAVAPALFSPQQVQAAPIAINLNRGLEIGWYSLRVQNPFGTNYTGLVSIKSYNPSTQEFVFINGKNQDVPINASDISFVYFRQLPDRADVNVKVGDIRNIQITPYREFLYDIPPGRLDIQDGQLLLNPRWRIAEQKPFGVDVSAPSTTGDTAEQLEIVRRIQLNYLGNRYLVETELVNLVTRSTPDPSGGVVPKRLPTIFPIPAPR